MLQHEEEVRMSVDYGILHGLISAIVQIDIGPRSRLVHYLREDIPINLEFPELLRVISSLSWGSLAAGVLE